VFRQRTEERGPIRRYRKGRSDQTKRASSPQAELSNVDGGLGSTPTGTPLTTQSETPTATPITGSPILPPSPSLESMLVTHDDRGWLPTLLVAGVFVVVIAAVVIPLISVGNTISSISHSVFSQASPVPRSSGSPAAVTPAKHASYLTAAGARAGLAQLSSAAPGARFSLVRIDASSVSATAQLPSGTSKYIRIESTGRFTGTTGGTGERPIPLREIRPSVIAKLVAEMGRRFHIPTSRIDYMVVSSPTGLPIRWILYTKAPAHPFTASLTGGHLARLPG
jgi:hypothetical protein